MPSSTGACRREIDKYREEAALKENNERAKVIKVRLYMVDLNHSVHALAPQIHW
jgi:hypothetical protein